MVYDPTTPQSNEFISVSQPKFRANFTAINSQYTQDHYALSGQVDHQGSHKKLQMPQQSSDPTVTTDEVALYSKDPGTGVPELYFREDTAGVWQATTNDSWRPGIKQLPL